MPPKVRSKSSGKGKAEKPTKAAAQQAVMEEAAKEAEKIYQHHEIQRVVTEKVDKAQRDFHLLDHSVERERLQSEKAKFKELKSQMMNDERLAYQEHNKHMAWEAVPLASRIPDVQSDAEVNTFLSVWKQEQESFDSFSPETHVYASRGIQAELDEVKLRFYKKESALSSSKMKQTLESQIAQCIEAYQLTEAIKVARDGAVSASDTVNAARHNANLKSVFQQIMDTMDFLSIQLLLFYDKIIDAADGETYMRAKPEDAPVVKFGQWIKIREMTRSFTTLTFPDLDIRLDPKTNTYPKLPKALGLSKEDVSLRAVQLAFDPFSAFDDAGKEYYALNCFLKVDLISFNGRPSQHGQWLWRGETNESHTLTLEPYPPQSTELRTEDPAFRVSFDVPSSIIIRTGTLLIGKWLSETSEWELCTHTNFNVPFSGASRVEGNPRRATFTISELAQYAVLQEKAYDAPFESWSIRPVRYDQAVFALEGKRRGDSGDREFRFLLEDTKCKLLAPEDADFAVLRESWLEPCTMFRELKQLGFNFVLCDADAKYVEDTLPKSKALENKAYADIAQFSLFYTFASSRHNKHGEDADMALFRMSTTYRPEDQEEDYTRTELSEKASDWNSIRYRKENCVISTFSEEEDQPRLDVASGQQTHFNLFFLLSSLRSEDEVREQLEKTNYLLRVCIYQMLCLVRPLSWA